MIENKPDFAISSECCTYSKKRPAKKYEKEHNIELMITGIRKAEGGQRSTAYNTCFYETRKTHDSGLFMPLFWYKLEDLKKYEAHFCIENSLCYTVYGFKRTGCACCPYAGRNIFLEMEVLRKHEPKLYRAVNNIFGKSYEYTEEYYIYRDNKKKEMQQKTTTNIRKQNIKSVENAIKNFK